ncbi:MAG: hypothetical protein M0R46_03475 [Candidatus Muirbacterium halophilum]|nr:hypothetical protein [Candidatus Muirbacterium halophilum]MCK9474950.1 hypothetical protein [Candidatus Muirbacterium halophilum]
MKNKNLINILNEYIIFFEINRFCQEDKLSHNGRLCYYWTICNFLKKNTDFESIEFNNISKQIFLNIKKNKFGDTIIFPGLENRKNYSTNSIDCGIFLDSFFDYIEYSDKKEYLNLADKVFEEYAIKKISADNLLHNQNLWLLAGISRYIKERDKISEYKLLVKKKLDEWFLNINSDGSFSYYGKYSNKGLSGISPYYHSRCTAFSWYIIKNLGLDVEEYIVKLKKTTEFLCIMYRDDLKKEICLESKRYYFNSEFEFGSLPYDLYCFYKMYDYTKDLIWKKRFSIIFNKFIKSNYFQEKDNWQCDIMRCSHGAWLCRIPYDFYKSLEKYEDKEFSLFELNYKNDFIKSFFINFKKYFVILKKTSINPISGGRVCGLVLYSEKLNINDISYRYCLHYYKKGFFISNFKYLIDDMKGEMKNIIYAIFDSFFHKKRFRLAYIQLKLNFFSYIRTLFTTFSSEFVLNLNIIEENQNSITYFIEICDIKGNNKKVIGERKIEKEQLEIKVYDIIYKENIGKIFFKGFDSKIKKVLKTNIIHRLNE